MKLVILAVCICAASAASFGAYRPYQAAAKASVQIISTPYPFIPEVPVAKATYPVTATPVVAKVYTAGKEAEAAILRSESDVKSDGFNYNFETANGIASQGSGVLKKVEDADVLISQGSYQYTAPDGTFVQLSYVADENGYQPRSDLLPVGPPIPKEIAAALEYIRTHPQKTEN